MPNWWRNAWGSSLVSKLWWMQKLTIRAKPTSTRHMCSWSKCKPTFYGFRLRHQLGAFWHVFLPYMQRFLNIFHAASKVFFEITCSCFVNRGRPDRLSCHFFQYNFHILQQRRVEDVRDHSSDPWLQTGSCRSWWECQCGFSGSQCGAIQVGSSGHRNVHLAGICSPGKRFIDVTMWHISSGIFGGNSCHKLQWNLENRV